MKRALHHIIYMTLAMVIFISTSGFMIFVHHCHHQNETFASVFFNFNDQSHHNCHPVIQTTCCHDKGDGVEGSCDDRCCKEIVHYVKISTDTEPVQHLTLKLKPVMIDLPAEALCCPSEEEANTCITLAGGPPPKPPLTGKEISVQHHQLKLGYLC